MFSGEWRSDLPTVLPIRTKRLDIFPRDIQKQVSEAKRMEEEKEEKDKEEVRRRAVGECCEPIEQEEEDAREEELQPKEGASEAEVSGGRNDEAGVSEGEERETSLNATRSGGSEEDSEGSPLLIRRGNDEDDDERRSPVLTSPRERTPVPIGGGAVQTGTSSRGAAILRRAPGFSFPDKVDFHYEGPAPLVYVPEKCGEFLCQLRGRAKPLPRQQARRLVRVSPPRLRLLVIAKRPQFPLL
ncbi:hypothetical protein F2Q70_00021030 [Brassica cretica]|uniref:Uncharacterized protein n=1 Tax=Brassica cretica TaxID=69181 RepID=A0A8S9GLQ1_BRACR|nr:hypothetical protein F2Q70_00021030 [Brassica cretica]